MLPADIALFSRVLVEEQVTTRHFSEWARSAIRRPSR
jgi:hypothetical protein